MPSKKHPKRYAGSAAQYIDGDGVKHAVYKQTNSVGDPISFKEFIGAHGPRYLLYEKGYSQALLDVHSWWNTHGARRFCKEMRINHGHLINILRLFFECRNRFQRQGLEFQIVVTPKKNSKGKIEWEYSAPFKEVILPEEEQ